MAETVQARINQYLEDVIGAERNFEKALATFASAGEQSAVQQLFARASARAKTQHERLEALLRRRGGTPSPSKTILAEMLAFSPLSAQAGQGAAEKNTQHLIVCTGAAGAEMAMYECLATSAALAGDSDVVALARELREEERDDYRQVWQLLGASAADAYQAEIAKGTEPTAVLHRYLEDTIAAEKSFEAQLLGFCKEARNSAVETLFRAHATETKEQYSLLEDRLQQLGGSTSTLKSVLAHIFAFAPRIAQVAHDPLERETQDLMIAHAVENAEVAIYESLAQAAQLAGDTRTLELARHIQKQEQATAELVWEQLAPAARRAMQTATTA